MIGTEKSIETWERNMSNIREEKLDFWIKNGLNVLFIGKHGVGKCLGKGTPVLMYDGRTVPVELVRHDDLVMGPDSTPRKVAGIARGRSTMYKVVPTKGDAFVCNGDHLLSLKMAGKDEVFDMSVENFLSQNDTFRRRSMLFRTGVEFKTGNPPQPAYMLGLWLGDGTSARSQITTTDLEIMDYICDYANERGLVVSQANKSGIDYGINSGTKGKRLPRSGRNEFLSFLKDNDLLNNKHIPHEYLTAATADRLGLLAGLIDADGELANNCFSITQKSPRLTQDILFLARSLGFAAYATPCKKSCTYQGVKKVGNYYRVTISGDIDAIPCSLCRKKGKPRTQVKDVLKTGIKKIENLGEGDYYGFTLDGDGRFLLGDFTVTHNTSMVKDAFERNDLKWLYFSAATMDPWVDFIGVPKERTTDKKWAEAFDIIKELISFDVSLGVEWIVSNWKFEPDAARKVIEHVKGVVSNNGTGEVFLDLVRPKSFADDTVQALFFDEFNRAPKKVRNAVMELLQFKSINGKKFNNLKMVWAAINPSDDEENEYDVETLDPAQADRFHITIEIPYQPNGEWFKQEFGEQTAKIAIAWWNDLPDEEKKKVSPRRLEYALAVRKLKGDMRDVLPVTSNVSKLTTNLNTGHTPDKLEALMKANDVGAARTFLANENNYASSMKYIPSSDTMMQFFLPLLSPEKLGSLMADQEGCTKHIINNSDKVPLFQDVCKNIMTANSNQRLVKKIRRALTENQDLATSYTTGSKSGVSTPAVAFFAKKPAEKFTKVLAELKAAPKDSAHQRNGVYEKIEKTLPETLTADEALTVLELVSGSFKDAWPSTFTAQPMENLMGIINHCVGEIHRNTGLDWTGILNRHGTRFRDLLAKVKEGGLSGKLLCPASK